MDDSMATALKQASEDASSIVAAARQSRQIKLDTAAREADEDVRRFEEEQRAVLAAASAGDASLDHHRAKTAEETAAIIAAMDRSFEAGKDSASSFLVAVATSTDALSKHAKLLSGRK
ncbi:hypothetical protein FNF27_01529 [Cafeteria roenbergensis]|uniref:V-type proton ATPase subunit G n=1 Tax=Cafeteria roenbergensis TaxID=33653 RepID=A0A5A8EMM0_CAFRO|nr:hypothetical protein FNF29_07416 [Cafeteria roenbergensis]KAA0154592.1 hypothetical protein FNF31_06247 [Cafeteria roenbergensis]KAA0167016.1 hypothetical protein FNF28_02939 [Cafeteria roenbergensis]KAA0177200.1 hypothetical protein FNF27_01529 [Cafeteria roenbergensis]|eukprot:KAA0147348.1 hypothetical protein FNF29_07416 [Cafeteria roenbergensis]